MQTIDITAQSPASQVLTGDSLTLRLPAAPRRYYYHGWQSWSLAAWVDADAHIPISQPRILHPMQLDPVHAQRRGHHGSWVGAVEIDPGDVILLGSLALDAHVSLHDGELKGEYETNSGEWLIARGDESTVFKIYADELGKRLGAKKGKPAPRVWCSWYSLYTAIDEPILASTFSDLSDLPFDVLQVDDGWQQKVGDWTANDKFPGGMQALADSIRRTGRDAGLWLAPLIAVRSSRLFHEHPGWFLHDERGRLVSAGFNWGEDLFALDTTHPSVIDWLSALMQQVRAWGFNYLKLDFLYAGALPGARHADLPREAAYRAAIQLLRDSMGSDAYFLACGAPIMPSLGLCDALRIGPDVAGNWEDERDAVLLHNPAIPGTRNAIRTTLNRLWLAPLVQPDPDVVYFRSVDCRLRPDQKRLLQSLALLCGFRATSDLPQWLTATERDALRAFLLAAPNITQTNVRSFSIDGHDVDFSTALPLHNAPTGWTAVKSVLFSWLADHRLLLRFDHALGKRALARRLKRIRK